ncbi:MAG: hypothetical protein K0U98_10455 [Deltaproteobacteria bacterium]|nr:hypothetical protein [Deltaproteobacteria bacterium]
MKVPYLSTILVLALSLAPLSWAAENDPLEVCPAEGGIGGNFADCTEAECSWNRASARMVCKCIARKDVASVTTGTCQEGTHQKLQSRYPGVASLGICKSATNYWGDCLGVDCQVGSDGIPLCACKVANSQQRNATQYVITGVGASGASTACSSQVYYSSATPASVAGGSLFLGVDFPEISWVYPTTE